MTEFTTEVQRWEAVLAHERAADGLFWYAVKTTRVYCRPACPSRRPRRENVTFFDSPEEAVAAGFRACRRCQPERVNAAAQAVATAQYLLDTAQTEPSLSELAAAVGLSPFHLQRVFKERLGVSPKQYAVRVRTDRLKTGLRNGQSVTTALYEAGHDSPATLYARSTDQLGMTPRTYARGGHGEMIQYTGASSPLGQMLVAATARGLCAVRFGNMDDMVPELRAEYPKAEVTENAEALKPYVTGILEYLSGQNTALNLRTDAGGTDFQQRVWDALRRIPYGETRSYAELAQMIGEPGAVRAVASACARNPVALVVPCHRIVRTGGALGGYRWGLDMKQRLLDTEKGKTGQAQPTLF
ncbi:bifunctional DNA-binding transcriptional regulator/O6-methylguanine-DNA methyltransferase Ada [Deinococcus cavernae]|uniref:methylated-DNA--[protein]-cysteine S-methyltransferase n=1 Tax=Deinococcus cavernae TaxID=2320857 RepID=A0A418VA46_9DEIO|nr:bifunctional DNA-binding transcriptional regulator/O6-methylguanine-DNA methyltransferase Ada [Deinococcus cavernae]RJF72991.1 bifunctional DNA-binding transcriptional regulator/O6-methylguanine-DNA methyltransferase Ada [Deinococcus cavernae]